MLRAQPLLLVRHQVVANNLRSQPGAYETAGSVLGTIADIVRYDRPDNWVELRNAQIRGLTAAQVNAAAGTLAPGAMTWVVVGDLSKIEQPIRDMKLGTVTVIDADGKPVR